MANGLNYQQQQAIKKQVEEHLAQIANLLGFETYDDGDQASFALTLRRCVGGKSNHEKPVAKIASKLAEKASARR